MRTNEHREETQTKGLLQPLLSVHVALTQPHPEQDGVVFRTVLGGVVVDGVGVVLIVLVEGFEDAVDDT